MNDQIQAPVIGRIVHVWLSAKSLWDARGDGPYVAIVTGPGDVKNAQTDPIKPDVYAWAVSGPAFFAGCPHRSIDPDARCCWEWPKRV